MTNAPAPRRYVGTFHKTGTVLMLNVLRRFTRRTGHTMWNAAREDEPSEWDICFDPNTRFLEPVEAEPVQSRVPDHHHLRACDRAVVLLRDPRDIVLSAARYHATSNERWLHQPREQFAGRSYQEAINALDGEEARVLFEIEHHSRRNIRRILTVLDALPPDGSVALVRLEDLMVDTDLSVFHRLFSHLGLRAPEILDALEAAYAHSLFHHENPQKHHVQHGRPGLWREKFTPAMATAFEQHLGAAVERMGYDE